MRILHVGASGSVGAAAGDGLRARGHEVISAHRSSEDHPVDITDAESIRALMDKVGEVDALVSTAGKTPFGVWDELDRSQMMDGLDNKFLGQVELVRQGTSIVRDGGSFTLTSGILGRAPVRNGAVAAAINGALEAWVVASAGELWGRYRINIVSPTVLDVSAEAYANAMPGFTPVSSTAVGDAFVRSVESMETGHIYVP